ncbi:MAG TPA: SgcJ/EcaC family oxidoreductase [Myxococcales bacterium]|nr:SgcJ/EcaC family oxidoreductase [Myxococcales bacterium]
MIEAFEGYKTAVFAKDVEAFLSLYDKDVRVFDLWGDWFSEGIEALRKGVTGWFGSLGTDTVAASFGNIQTTVSGDLAMATAFTTYRGLSAEGKELRSMQNRLTWGLQRRNGVWKIIHEHTSAPVDPETTKAILKP